jgi:hypothetical protein
MNNPEFSKQTTTIQLLKDTFMREMHFDNYSFKPADNIIVVSLSTVQKEKIPAGIYYKTNELSQIISEDKDVFGTIKHTHQYHWIHTSKEKDCLQRFAISKEDLTQKVMTKYRFTGKTQNHTLFSFFRNNNGINPYQEHSEIRVLKNEEEIMGLPEGKYTHKRNFDILIQKSPLEEDYTFLRVISFDLETKKYQKTEITHHKQYGRKI